MTKNKVHTYTPRDNAVKSQRQLSLPSYKQKAPIKPTQPVPSCTNAAECPNSLFKTKNPDSTSIQSWCAPSCHSSLLCMHLYSITVPVNNPGGKQSQMP